MSIDFYINVYIEYQKILGLQNLFHEFDFFFFNYFLGLHAKINPVGSQ